MKLLFHWQQMYQNNGALLHNHNPFTYEGGLLSTVKCNVVRIDSR